MTVTEKSLICWYYKSHSRERRPIRSIPAADVVCSPTPASSAQQQERCEPHGAQRWVEPPRSTAGSHSFNPARHVCSGSSWLFRGLIFYRLSSRRQGMKACTEFHAGRTPWIHHLQSDAFVDAQPRGELTKNKSLASLWRNWDEAATLKSGRGSDGRAVPAGLNKFRPINSYNNVCWLMERLVSVYPLKNENVKSDYSIKRPLYNKTLSCVAKTSAQLIIYAFVLYKILLQCGLTDSPHHLLLMY